MHARQQRIGLARTRAQGLFDGGQRGTALAQIDERMGEIDDEGDLLRRERHGTLQ